MSEYVRKRCIEGDASTRKSRGTTRIVKTTMIKPRPTTNSRPGSLAQVRHGLNALAASLTAKASGKPQPPTRIEKIEPVDAIGAIGLRSAFGLSTKRELCEQTAREASDHVRKAATKAETSATGHPGRPVDPLPAAVRPTFVTSQPDAQTQPVSTTGAAAAATPFIATQYASVWQSIYALWQRAGRRSLSVDPAEVSRMTGLSVDQVRAAIEVLLETGQLTKDPGRAGAAFMRLQPVV